MALPRDILFTATGNPKASAGTHYDVFDLPPSLERLVMSMDVGSFVGSWNMSLFVIVYFSG